MGRRALILALAMAALVCFPVHAAAAKSLTPTSHDYGKQRVGKKSAGAVFTLRTTTCAEIDPARPNCEDMVFPAILVLPSIRVTGDFVIVRNRCHGFPVASADGSPCQIVVAFTPTRRGARRGRLETAFGVAVLSGKGFGKAKGKR